MRLGLRHDEFRGLVDRVARTIPVKDYAIDAAAYHVVNLIGGLLRIGGAVAIVHVA